MKSPSINSLTIRHFWKLSIAHKKDSLLSLFIPVQAVITSTLIPFLIGKILASLGRSEQHSYHLAVALFIAMIAGLLFNLIGFSALFRLQPKVMAELEAESLNGLLRRGLGFHNNHVAGKLVTDATEYPAAYVNLNGLLMGSVIPFVTGIIAGITIVAINSPLLGLIVFVMTASIIAMAIWQTIIQTENRRQRHQARRDEIAHLADTITNVQNVKIFAREEAEMRRHGQLSDQLRFFRQRDFQRMATDGTIRISALMAFELAFILIVIKVVHDNPGLLAIGIFTFSYALNLGNRLFDIGTTFRQVEDALLDASDTTQLLNEPVEIVDTSQASTLAIEKGSVGFRKVLFHYSDNPKQDAVFDGLSFDIADGEKVGLVGPSGGGKSSLVKLLLRFEDIQGGAILIDNQDISQVTQRSLREGISYVPQEPLLFHRTIKENIAYGLLGSSDEDVVTAAKQASAHGFISALPKGYDTIVGERGVKLSGGQRQRVAIARAMLKNAPILVLDEATSALDSESEVLIQDALWKLMEGRTAIVIAHRLSTIQKMDRIIVLDDGKIVEQGSHKELLRQHGTYAKLWAHQSGGFLDE